jgi:uridine kinase
MSLDDYYIDRERIPVAPDGSVDLEHINTIDTDLFGRHLRALMEGEEVERKLGRKQENSPNSNNTSCH